MRIVSRGHARGGILAVVALASALAAAGCGGSDSNATPPIIYITPAPPTLEPGATPTPPPPPPSVSDTLISTKAPDGKWTALFKKPVVAGLGSDAQAKINEAITNKINGYIDAFTSGNLPAVSGGAAPSTLEGSYTIAMDTHVVVSLRFSILTFVSGAAHPNAQAGGATFSVATGDQIALADLFTNTDDAVKILADKAHASLVEQLGSDLSWPDNVDFAFFERAWVMTPAGLEFAWNQGDIASQAAGRPVAVVSWADLSSVIKADGPAAGLAG